MDSAVKKQHALRGPNGKFVPRNSATTAPTSAPPPPSPTVPAPPAPPSNVLPFVRAPGPTLGEALASLRSVPPVQPAGIVVPDGQRTPSPNGEIVPLHAPPPIDNTPPASADNIAFAKFAAPIAVAVSCNVMAAAVRKQGFEPNEVDEEAELTATEQTEKAFLRGIGDRQIPWWAPLVAAYGSLYLNMRIGAEPLGSPTIDVTKEESAVGKEQPPVTPPPPPTKPSTEPKLRFNRPPPIAQRF